MVAHTYDPSEFNAADLRNDVDSLAAKGNANSSQNLDTGASANSHPMIRRIGKGLSYGSSRHFSELPPSG